MLVACTDTTAPFPAAELRPFAPPIQYPTWWRMVEACSGIQGDFRAVHWYTTWGDLIVGGQSYDGFWWQDGDRIALQYSQTYQGGTVRHEMLHALLQSGGHPPEYFHTRCGALTTCHSECAIREADRGVPSTAREIPSESLTVAVSLAPAGAPSMSIDSGWVTIMVTATNTRLEPVWVAMPKDIDGYYDGFGYVTVLAAGQLNWTTEPRWAFLAGESRSLAFDFPFNPPTVAVGAIDSVRAWFGHARSPWKDITLRP